MTSTLYFTRSNDPNLLQIQITAAFLNKTIPTQQINKKYDPLILLTPEGTLNQPTSILNHIVEGKLSGKSQQDKLKVWEWFEHFSLELHPLLRELYEQVQGARVADKEKFDYSVKELLRELDLINNHLKLRTFMIGDAMTIIDISLATHLDLAFQNIVTEDFRKKIPNLVRWFNYVRSTGPFVKILGEVKLCGKEGVTFGQNKQDEKQAENKIEKATA